MGRVERILTAVSDFRRIRRKQLVREAEGYLELVTIFADTCKLPTAHRDRLARRALSAILHLDPEDQDSAHALFLQGQAFRCLDRYEEAIVPLQKSAAQRSDNISVWLALGWCYKRIARLDRAMAAMEEALAAEPKEALLHYNLACYCSLAGHTDRALSSLATAFEIDPSYRELVAKESDFDGLRKHPSFLELTSVVV